MGSVRKNIIEGNNAASRTAQSAATVGSSAGAGMLAADEITDLLTAYFPTQPWDAWEPILAWTLAVFGGVMVDAIFRAIGQTNGE